MTLALQKLKAFSEVRGVPNLVLAGDFNSAPQHPVHDVIRTGSVSKESRSRLDTMTDWENLPPVSQNGVTTAPKLLRMLCDPSSHRMQLHARHITQLQAITAHGGCVFNTHLNRETSHARHFSRSVGAARAPWVCCVCLLCVHCGCMLQEEQRFAVKVLDLMPTAFTHDLKMHSAYFTAKAS